MLCTSPTFAMAGDPNLSKYLSNDELIELVSVFPAVEFAFAYGSGVIQQQVTVAVDLTLACTPHRRAACSMYGTMSEYRHSLCCHTASHPVQTPCPACICMYLPLRTFVFRAGPWNWVVCDGPRYLAGGPRKRPIIFSKLSSLSHSNS